jgi:hypothetical protein
VRITNAADLASIDHTQNLTVRWNGGDYSNDYAAIVQLSGSSTIICRTSATAGQLTISAALMQGLSQAANRTGLELLLLPKSDRIATFQVPLTNGGTVPTMFRSYSSEVLPVHIQ